MGIAMRTVILRPPYDCVRTCTNEMTEFITRSWIYGLRFYVLSYEGEILMEPKHLWALETHGRQLRHACMFTGETASGVYGVYT